MAVSLGLAAEWLFGTAVVDAAVVGGSALVATEVMAPIVVSAAGLAATGLTAAEAAALGITVGGGAAAMGAFDSAGNWVDPGYPGDGQPYDANGLPYGNTSSYEFGMPISDQQVAAWSQQQGISLGLPDAGWTWKDGVGWARNALGVANAAAGLYGTIQNGKYKVNAANAAANSSKLSAEDAARRAKQMETYGLDAAKTMQPWDESGGRKLAGDQLQALMKDPMSVASSDPAYKFRQQAAQRAMGIYGQDSGAMGVAAADASSTWYDQRLQQLSGLAGANAAPGAGGALGLNTLNSAANIAGMGQASGAFGQQAGLTAQNAQTTGNINTLGAVGNLVSTVGNTLSPSTVGPTFATSGGNSAGMLPPGTSSTNPIGTYDTGVGLGGPGYGDPFVGGDGSGGDGSGDPYVGGASDNGGPTWSMANIGRTNSNGMPETPGRPLLDPRNPGDASGPEGVAYTQYEGRAYPPAIPLQQQAQMSQLGGFMQKAPAPTPPQVLLSQVGGYTSPTPGKTWQMDAALTPDMWQDQMGDLLGNYMGSVGSGPGYPRMGA